MLTNKTRWSSLKYSWKERIDAMTKFLSKNVSVLDIGSGCKYLKTHVEEVNYYCLDLKEATYNYDLNTMQDEEWNKIVACDYIVCSGVLEYVRNLDAFIANISQKATNFVVSYASSDFNKHNRSIGGWLNCHSIADIIKMFSSNECRLVELAKFEKQTIFVFKRS